MGTPPVTTEVGEGQPLISGENENVRVVLVLDPWANRRTLSMSLLRRDRPERLRRSEKIDYSATRPGQARVSAGNRSSFHIRDSRT